MSQPGAAHDLEVDAIAIRFAPEGARYAESDEVAPGVVPDYDEQGQVIGVELLYVRDLLANGRGGTARAKPNAAERAQGLTIPRCRIMKRSYCPDTDRISSVVET